MGNINFQKMYLFLWHSNATSVCSTRSFKVCICQFVVSKKKSSLYYFIQWLLNKWQMCLLLFFLNKIIWWLVCNPQLLLYCGRTITKIIEKVKISEPELLVEVQHFCTLLCLAVAKAVWHWEPLTFFTLPPCPRCFSASMHQTISTASRWMYQIWPSQFAWSTACCVNV